MRTIRNALWLWGTRPNALQNYGFPQSNMTIGGGLKTLNLYQAMMCGSLPPTEEEYGPVNHCCKLFWEMSFGEDFTFQGHLEPIIKLHQAHPNITGVLLDDFSTTEINKGAQPEILARMREAMPDSLQLWLVIYSMSLKIPDLSEYLQYADGISFWVWHARELPQIRETVSCCNELSGQTPMILGLYFYDFGDQRRMTTTQMASQVQNAEDLLHDGECEGLCFLSSSVMDIGLETVDWTRKWIGLHGEDPI